MRIMHTIDEKLDVGFESVLILVGTGGHITLDLAKNLQHIHSRLLVTTRRVFEISERALELQCHVVVVDEACCDSRVEGNSFQALENNISVENGKVCGIFLSEVMVLSSIL